MGEVITKVEPGLEFRSIVADANALWIVRNLVSRSNDSVWHCDCLEEGYETSDVFRESKILSLANVERATEEMLSDHDSYYEALKIGEIVHYHNGFGQFIRCEVVVEGEKNVLKKIALVGDWKQHDLPRRNRKGEIDTPYSSNMGGTFQPNYGSIYECPEFAGTLGIDPKELDPIDLSVPEMTDKEVGEAALWTAVDGVHHILSQSGANDENPRLSLEMAKTIIEEALKMDDKSRK